MPPRYAYWTILVDNQPTAFRAGSKEELMPTFNRLKQKSPTAEMKWWQNGKLWDSRLDAQEAMLARGEMGRRGDERQSGFRSREGMNEWRPAGSGGRRESKDAPRPSAPREERDSSGKLGWKPKGEFTPAPPRKSDGPEWKPKGEFRPERPARADWKPKSSFTSDRPARPDWKSKSRDDRPPRSEKPEWKPKGPFKTDRPAKPEWKSKSRDDRPGRTEWKPKGAFGTERPTKPEWKAKSRDDRPARSEKPEWKPKGTFKADRPARPDWKSKSRDDRPRSAWKPKTDGPRGERPEWKPKGTGTPSRPQDLRTSGPRGERKDQGEPTKRKWVPKEEYKKSQGIEAKRDSKWRPGGLHKDPKQKYKDAKKAKWGRFKETIRKRFDAKKGGRKKKDDE